MEPFASLNGPESASQPQAPPQPQDWLTKNVCLRQELLFDTRKQGGKDIYVIEDPVRNKYFQIGIQEFEFVSKLNGEATVRETVARINRAGQGSITEADAVQICNWLFQNNLGYLPGADRGYQLGQQAKSLQNRKLMTWVNPISIKFKLFDPTQLLTATQKSLQWIFSRWFTVVWMLTGFVGLYSLFTNWDKLGQSSGGVLAEGRWVWMLVVWVVLKAIHEWAHGIACRRYGGEVSEAGLLLLLFTPMPYVNVTSSWGFKNRWHRFIVAGAGMYVELFVSFIAMIVWANSSHQLVQDICFNIFFLSSVTTILFNANPLMRFDGYYMLTDALNIPNLFPKGLSWFSDFLKRTLFGSPAATNICPANELPFVRFYGVCAFFWKILVSIGLLIAASVLFDGIGIVMAIVAGILWLAMPVFRFFKSVFVCPEPRYSIVRVASSSILVVLGVVSLFTWLGSPAKKSAPAIVQFENDQVLRAGGDGFVEKILVCDGQRVSAGDILLTLRNDELSAEVENLERLIEEAEIQARIDTNADDLAAAQTSLQNRESLLSQLLEKQEQLGNLSLVAPFDGIVFQRNLSNMQGEYQSHGTELLRIARSTSQKIVVSIDQGDLESIQGHEGASMRVVMPGVPVFQAAIKKIQSRASVHPKHLAFCASYGGPLPVQQAPDSDDSEQQENSNSYNLLSPRFDVELSIDQRSESRLCCGQVGRAFFQTKRQSLGKYLYIETRNWIENKFQQATGGY